MFVYLIAIYYFKVIFVKIKNQIAMKIILLLSVIIFGILGCLPQPEPEKLQQIVSEIETKNTNMTDMDWDKYEAEIATLSAEYEKNKETLSPEQRQEWNKLMGKYKAQQIKRGMDKLKLELKDLGEQADSFIEELTK
jgi:predicted PurR-regulated permease PerM